MKTGLVMLMLTVAIVHVNGQKKSTLDSMYASVLSKQDTKESYHLAEMYSNLGYPDSAMAILQRTLSFTTDARWLAIIHYTFAWQFANKGLYTMAEQEALTGLQSALDIKDSLVAATSCSILGNIADLNKLHQKAIEYRKRALLLQPHEPYYLFCQGYSLLMSGHTRKAMRALRRAQTMHLRGLYHSQANYFLGECYLRMNMLDSVNYFADRFKAELDTFPSIEPERRYYFWLMGRYHLKQHEPVKAKQMLKLAAANKSFGTHFMDDWNTQLDSIYKILITEYERENKKDSATFYLKQQLAMSDRLLTAMRNDAAGFQLKGVDEQIRKYENDRLAERQTRIQYLLITLIVLACLGVYLVIAGAQRINQYSRWISPFVLIITFEFILMVIDPLLTRWTNDQALYKFLLNVLIALILIPIDRWVGKMLVSFSEKIRARKVKSKTHA